MAKGAIQSKKKRARKASKELKANHPFWRAKRFPSKKKAPSFKDLVSYEEEMK